MKSTRDPFAAALFATILVSPLAQAATHIFNPTTSATYNWASPSTGWDSTPVSGIDTVLTFGNGAILASGAAVVSNNDIASPPFKLNALNMTYNGTGPDGATYTVDDTGSLDTIVVTIPTASATRKFVRVKASD